MGYPTRMSENPYAHPAPGDDALMERGPERTSVLAIGSFVFSLLCCIPGLGVVGALLGILAILMIGGSTRVKGRGFAIAGLVLGLLTTVVWIGIAVAAGGVLQKIGGYADVVDHLSSRNLTEAQVYFTDTEGELTQEMVDTFAQALSDNWGATVKAPGSIIEWFQGYSAAGKRVETVMKQGQLEYGNQGVMPIPFEMEQGHMAFIIVMDIQNTNAGTVNDMPRLSNIGFVDANGGMIWLFDPDG